MPEVREAHRRAHSELIERKLEEKALHGHELLVDMQDVDHDHVVLAQQHLP